MLDFLQTGDPTLRRLFDSISEGVLVVDLSGKPVFWNAAAEAILGAVTLRQDTGAWLDRSGVLADDGITPLSGGRRPLARAIRGEDVKAQEFVVQRPGGDALLSSSARPLLDTAGNIVGAVAIFREVTESRRMERALRESERLYRTLAKHLPASVVMMFDRELRFILADGGGLVAAGFTSEQIEGKPVVDYATPSLLPAYAAVFDGIASNSVVERGGRQYRVQLVPARDEEDRVFAGLMVAHDVTEHVLGEEMRRGEEHFRLLAEMIPQIIWTAEPNGELDYYNQRWFDYTGMTLEQTKGWGWEPVVHPEDLQHCVDVWSHAVRTGENYEVQYRFKRAADGAYRWHLGRARPLRNSAGKIVKWFGTCTDIDDQRRAEASLLATQQELEARVRERTLQLSSLNVALEDSVREKEVLLKEVHHRVKNNLQVISSLLKLHAEQVTDPAALAAFQDSQSRVRAIALLHEQLYQSKNLGRVGVAAYAETLVLTLARASARRAVRFSVQAGEVSLPVDSAVPFGLILNELVTNCLKHAFPDGEVESPAIHVELRAVADELELVVSDNGPGFPGDFDATTAKSLGMHLVLALVGQLGGTVDFSSEGGAKCRVLFPRPLDRAAP